MNRPEHGGDGGEMERRFGRPADGWLDLSTGINPQPYPVLKPNTESWGPLPTQGQLSQLQQAAAECYGASSASLITAAPGTQALIQWLPRMRPTSRVGIVSPTYNEHAHCWRTAGHTVQEINSLSEAGQDFDVVIVVNPNNPDGRRYEPDSLKALAHGQSERSGWLIIDEAFCDLAPELSVAPDTGAPGLIVLRSFGKFYGLAGLRLGFAITDPLLAERLAVFLGPWAISTPAITAGIQALGDKNWIEKTKLELRKSAKRLDRLLAGFNLNPVGGTDLFRLVASDDAALIADALAKSGILVRRFEHRPEWLRFGFPGIERDWVRLENTLSATFDPAAMKGQIG